VVLSLKSKVDWPYAPYAYPTFSTWRDKRPKILLD